MMKALDWSVRRMSLEDGKDVKKEKEAKREYRRLEFATFSQG